MNRLDKRKVTLNFSNVARDYEQHAVLQKQVAGRLLSRLDLMKLEPGWIVDAGSGTGFCARALKQKYRSARIMQIDLSPAMLFHSRRRSSRWFSGQYYLCADAELLPVMSARIDLVFSSLMLQWCNDPESVYAETRRILRPNGLFLFATLGPESLRELRESWAGVDNGRHVHDFLDLHHIGDGLIKAGLEGVVMESEKITLTYQDCTHLMRDLKAVGATNAASSRNKGLTGSHKIQRMVQNYERYRVDGLLPATYEIIYGHAWAPLHAQLQAGARAVFVPVEALKRHREKQTGPDGG